MLDFNESCAYYYFKLVYLNLFCRYPQYLFRFLLQFGYIDQGDFPLRLGCFYLFDCPATVLSILLILLLLHY